jgi:hypothetical protein
MFGGIVGLIIQLIAGAVGGNSVSVAAKQLDLGPVWNSIAGIVGGGIGGQILGAVLGGGAAASSGLDIGSIVEQVVAGGGILMASS